jgi:hypothetical protein
MVDLIIGFMAAKERKERKERLFVYFAFSAFFCSYVF